MRLFACTLFILFHLNIFAQGSTCNDALNIATLPFTAISQTTCGKGADYGSACRLVTTHTSGQDAVYKFIALNDGCIQINISNVTLDLFGNSGVSIFDGCPGTGGAFCRQAAGSTGNISFNVKLTSGRTYYIIVDAGPDNTSCLEKFDIEVKYISCPPPLVTGKEDGIDCGGNLGFELGNFTNWKGLYNNDISKYSGPPVNPPIQGFKPDIPKLNDDLGDCGMDNTKPAGSNDTQTPRHTITTGNGTDPNTGNKLPVVAPGGGNYSFRLGNQEPNAGTECIEIMFTPSPAAPIFTYLYAIVSDDNPVHPPEEKARFEMSLKDADGKNLPCGGVYTITSGAREDDGFIESPDACDAGIMGAEVWWTPWRAVSVDLSDYLGQNLMLRFCTADCSRSGHYTYAYLDAFCYSKKIKGTTICSTGDTATLTAPVGFTNYTWYKGPYSATGTPVATGPTYHVITPVDGTIYTVVYESFQSFCPIKLYATDTLKVFQITASSDTVICNGAAGTIKLKASSNDTAVKYTWSPATNLSCTDCADPSVVLPLAGTTTYTVNANGPFNCKATESVKITVRSCGTSVTASDGIICPGQCTSISATANGGEAPFKFTWTPGGFAGEGPHKVCPTSTTAYTVTLTDKGGFTASAVAVVTVNPTPDINITATSICAGGTTTLTASGSVDAVYSWSAGTNPTTGPVVTARPAGSTTYNVLGTSVYGCTNTATVQVTVAPVPVITASNEVICAGQSATLNAGGGAAYSWSTGDTTKKIVVNPSVTTFYTVVGFSKAGCSNSAGSMVTVYPKPKADFSASPQPTTIFSPTIYFKDLSAGDPVVWNWTFWDHMQDNPLKSYLQHPVAYKYTDTGRYLVKLAIINKHGCKDSISKYIMIGPEWSFYIPNTFTPNNDGKNDGFIGRSWNVIEHQMWIFDRWGNMIYTTGKTKDPESAVSWDGKVNTGTDITKIDTYVWVVVLKDVFEKRHKYIGHVNLIK